MCTAQSSVMMAICSLSDGASWCTHKFRLADLPVLIEVELVDHRLQLLIVERLAELLGDTTEIAQADLARAVVVEEPERPPHLVERISRQDALGH